MFQCYTYVVPGKKNALQVNNLQSVISIFRDPAGTRTQGPIIKSDVLYQLSYEISEEVLSDNLLALNKRNPLFLGVQKYGLMPSAPKISLYLFLPLLLICKGMQGFLK